VFNLVVSRIFKRFHANHLILNVEKTNIVKFTPIKSLHYPLDIEYVGKLLTEVSNIIFHGIKIDDHCNWKSLTELILPKLCTACFTVRRLFYVLNIDAVRIVYFAYFYSLLKYGIIFWRNCVNIKWVFVLQKRIIRAMVGVGSRCSCRSLFKKLNILPVPCIYTYIYIH
jgi:hypothetical protein